MAARSLYRSPVLLAAATLLALGLIALGAIYLAAWRTKVRTQAQLAEGSRYTWLTQALDACEADAARQPGSLYFMVVPLVQSATAPDGALRARAMDNVGAAALFDSKVAMQELENGAVRISREQFILHALDVPTNGIYRWNSVSGVSVLSERHTALTGPFKIRLQTAPNDPLDWSNVTAEGVGTCHWVFALLPR
jgi:hypothetical protein